MVPRTHGCDGLLEDGYRNGEPVTDGARGPEGLRVLVGPILFLLTGNAVSCNIELTG